MFSAQAQKEFTVNAAFALIDALLHCIIEGESNEPPASPIEGQCWIVGTQPSGDWADQAGQIACRQAGNWLFASPAEGMVAFVRSTNRIARFIGSWVSADVVAAPTGGSVVDIEARSAIGQIIAALEAGGLVAPA